MTRREFKPHSNVLIARGYGKRDDGGKGLLHKRKLYILNYKLSGLIK